MKAMCNLDDTHFLMHRTAFGVDVDRAEMERFIDQYAGTSVSDFILCVNAQLSVFPSKVIESYVDKYHTRVENGKPVDYTDVPVVKGAHTLFECQKIDYFEVMIERLRHHGMRPWLAMRMNDCHNNADETHWLLPEFKHQHPEYRRVQHRDYIGYFDRCLNYGLKPVRDRMLSYIEECVNRYDADGLELDFQREIYLFEVGREWENIPVLTQFMRDARKILDQAGEKWGHPIRLSVRVCADPQVALDLGMDVCTWAREKLVDTVVVTPRWETTDCDLPLEMWRRLLPDTEIAAGLEVRYMPHDRGPAAINDTAHMNALAAQYLSMGADKIYLFNFFDDPCGDMLAGWIDGGFVEAGKKAYLEDYRAFLACIGDRDACVRAQRRHTISYSDIVPLWKKKAQQLPASSDRLIALRVRVGEVPAGMKAEIRVSASQRDFALYANSRACRYVRDDAPDKFMPQGAMVFELENDGHLPPFIVIELVMEGKMTTVDGVEVHICE